MNANVLKRKLRTLKREPRAVLRKYLRIFKHRVLLRADPREPAWGDDYNLHWPFGAEGARVLDIGADYGSSAYYFLLKGAREVVAVEGDPKQAFLLAVNARRMRKLGRVVPVAGFVGKPVQVDALILKFKPDVVKVDIEGWERALLGCRLLARPREWWIEAHSEGLRDALAAKLREAGYEVEVRGYRNVWVLRACATTP